MNSLLLLPQWSLLLLLSLSAGQLKSQSYNVISSKFDYNTGNIKIHKIIGHDSGSYYVLKNHSNQFYLEKLDASLNLVAEKSVKLFVGLRGYDLEAVVHFHGQLYLFVSLQKYSETILYYQRIDKNTLLPIEEFVEITTIQFIKGNWPDFYFALSHRESKLMIAAVIKLNWAKIQHNQIFVFDRGLELLWKKKDFIEFTGQGPRENVYEPDEQGNVSVLSLIREESIISLFRDVKNSYKIFRYTNEGMTFREYPVVLDGRYIRGVKILGCDNGELICSGLYSDLYRPGVGGTFFFKIDSEGRIFVNQTTPLTGDLLASLSALNEPMMAHAELLQYKLTDLIPRNNGNIIMITEQVFEQTYNTYNNLIIICFDAFGQLNWSQVILKRQNFDLTLLEQPEIELGNYRGLIRETGMINEFIQNYCSYALIAPRQGDDITLVYNDNVRNLTENKKYRGFGDPRRSSLIAVHIDANGSLSRSELVRWKRKLLYPEPMRYYDTLGETIIVPAYKTKKFNYYKITSVH